VTEAEWMECTDPKSLVLFIQDEVSDRKKRLFACAACRQIWAMLEEIGKQAVVVAERFADGEATTEEQARLENLAWWGADNLNYEPEPIWFAGWAAHSAVSEKPIEAFAFVAQVLESKDVELCPLIRDVFGNPFRPTVIDSRWRTSTVLDLATVIYQKKAFDRMPILADALQDAGCDSQEMIGHCRGAGLHLRGCWVVDLLLGKS
jgi:hypothetical protein